ncbi:MAG TPA: hypothetical protein DCK93_04915 [Blastocatellia bacterium]|nr:hypothetical protein [Blastocatellia bacterium]
MTAAASETQRSDDLMILFGFNARPSLCAIADQPQLGQNREQSVLPALFARNHVCINANAL